MRYDRLRLAPYGGGRHQGVIRGNFMHWLTHTHAILKLPTMGYRDLAQHGHRALRAHIDRQPPTDATTNFTPPKYVGLDHFYTMDYWGNPALHDHWLSDSLVFAHVVKQLYAYSKLRERVSNQDILPACDHLVLYPFVDPKLFES